MVKCSSLHVTRVSERPLLVGEDCSPMFWEEYQHSLSQRSWYLLDSAGPERPIKYPPYKIGLTFVPIRRRA